MTKNSSANAGAASLIPGEGKTLEKEDPLEKEMAPTPVFLPGEFHGQSSLVGYSPWGCEELDMTEVQQMCAFHLLFTEYVA